MLPPGLAKRGDLLYTLTDAEYEGQSATQNRLLSLLQRRGPLRGRQIDHALQHVRWQSSLTSLVKRGIVQQDPVLGEPDVKPKMIKTARLAIPPERVAAVATRLGRESRRANVLEVLLATRGGRLNLSAVMLAVGCTEGPIRTLEADGDVTVGSRETWVELVLSPGEIAARLEAGDYRRAPAQTAVLEALLTAAHPLTTHELNTPAVARLEAAGVVQRVSEPAAVELALSPEETRQRIIALRGGQPYLDILNALAATNEPVDVKDLPGATTAQLERLA
jgi:hypothetical protein